MDVMNWISDQHQIIIQQCFIVPFALLFYFLAKRGHISLAYRHLFLSLGGSLVAVVIMGIYSLLLFISTVVFALLIYCIGPGFIHPWAFGIQMLWQTFWHLVIQYWESYRDEPTSHRLFTAVSSLMLLTQRITSVSMDLQDGIVALPSKTWPPNKEWIHLLPLCSYSLNFTTLLGGPLCSYKQFVSLIEGTSVRPPPHPLRVVLHKLMQVALLELLRYCVFHFLASNSIDSPDSGILFSILWVWCLGAVHRIRYYSHWKISECLNNAAGLGFCARSPGRPVSWGGLSDGDLWTTEKSSRVSEFARRWNATTATWLRRLVFSRCQTCPLLMTFGFSAWWHGMHPGQFVGFLGWAAAVKADYCIHRYLSNKLTSHWKRLLYTFLNWINTQMIITCVVLAVELRNLSSLRLLALTPLFLVLNTFLLLLLPHARIPCFV